MIGIVKHGDKNIIECNFCRTTFKCSFDDMKKKHYSGGKRSFISRYVKCPDCKNKVFVKV